MSFINCGDGDARQHDVIIIVQVTQCIKKSKILFNKSSRTVLTGLT